MKKLAKKAIPSSREDNRFGQRDQSFQDSTSACSDETAPSTVPGNLATENMAQESLSLPNQSGFQSHSTMNADAEVDDKVMVDEGTLCLNLLLTCLFFDATRNDSLCTLIQAQIQVFHLNNELE